MHAAAAAARVDLLVERAQQVARGEALLCLGGPAGGEDVSDLHVDALLDERDLRRVRREHGDARGLNARVDEMLHQRDDCRRLAIVDVRAHLRVDVLAALGARAHVPPPRRAQRSRRRRAARGDVDALARPIGGVDVKQELGHLGHHARLRGERHVLQLVVDEPLHERGVELVVVGKLVVLDGGRELLVVADEREARDPRAERGDEQRFEHLARLLHEHVLGLQRGERVAVDGRAADGHADHLHHAQQPDLLLEVEPPQLGERLVVRDHLLIVRLLPRVVPPVQHRMHQPHALGLGQVVHVLGRLVQQVVHVAVRERVEQLEHLAAARVLRRIEADGRLLKRPVHVAVLCAILLLLATTTVARAVGSRSDGRAVGRRLTDGGALLLRRQPQAEIAGRLCFELRLIAASEQLHDLLLLDVRGGARRVQQQTAQLLPELLRTDSLGRE